MAAQERTTCLTERSRGAGHHLEKTFLDLRVEAIGHDCDGKGADGLRVHGVAIGEGMVGSHLAKDKWIVDQGAEEIHSVDGGEGRRCEDCAVVRGIKPKNDCGRVSGQERAFTQPRHHAIEHRDTHLGPAAAAPHRGVGERIEGLLPRGERHRWRVSRVATHTHTARRHWRRQSVLVSIHPRAVDVVLERPQPARFKGHRPPRGHACAVTVANEAQEGRLRHEGGERLPKEGPAQVVGEGHALTDSEDTSFGPGVLEDRGHIPGRKY
mmetsp:Transcript_63408/g.125409  ORF Transcript_63408/g.125409 Transcript_63408/m.125409 type:complete len:267 (-) Transcript_63408:104-904(-)